MAYGLAQRGICVISGLAYGIDAHAHRAALAGSQGEGPATLAVLAGGLDRDYPSGNADLAAAIRGNGLTLSELPPGSAPTRHRFLQRNRIIAALAGVTCVVEARWRSGALNTAHHAETIARHVAAVPGSVHSANSAGCHRLLKEGGGGAGVRCGRTGRTPRRLVPSGGRPVAGAGHRGRSAVMAGVGGGSPRRTAIRVLSAGDQGWRAAAGVRDAVRRLGVLMEGSQGSPGKGRPLARPAVGASAGSAELRRPWPCSVYDVLAAVLTDCTCPLRPV